MDTLLSIVIPVFNVRPYIERCMDSILNQANKGVEIILVDDGSNDGSESICDDYSIKYPFIKTVHKRNEGVSIARNTGIEIATGQWISFVDPDDYVENNYFSSFLSLTKKEELVFFSLRIFLDNGNTEDKVIPDGHFLGADSMQKQVSRMMFNEQNCEFFVFTVNKFFRRDIIVSHNIRFIPHLTLREDELFTLDYYFHINSFSTSSKCLYCYQIDVPNSLSHTKKPVDEFLVFIDNALMRIDGFTDFELKSMEYDRILHYILNEYDKCFSSEEIKVLLYRVKRIVKERFQYIAHLKKATWLKCCFYLPDSLSFYIMKLYLERIQSDNLHHDRNNPDTKGLW